MKIRCKVCANTDGTVCLVKNIGVAQNKPRRCDHFEYSADKAKPISQMKATYTPYHLRSKKEYKKYLIEEMKERIKANTIKQTAPDCLARFRASVLEDQPQ